MPKKLPAPEHWPYCRSTRTTKKGTRTTKFHSTQIYYCRKCNRRFSTSKTPHHTYRSDAVITAPCFYYLGYSMRETTHRLSTRFHINPSINTVSRWIKDFGKYSALKKSRNAIKAFDKPHKIIILDYKPGASNEKHVHEQLLIYAIALSTRTQLHLKHITCAWFDDKNYYRIPSMDLYKKLKMK